MSVKVIIPYNFSANDAKSMDFVTSNYLGREDVHLALFHGYQPVPVINSLNNPIMDKMNQATSHLRKQLNDQERMLAAVKQQLVAKGFRPQQIDCLFVALKEDLASDLIRLIINEKYDAVVLNKNPGNIINYFTRSLSGRIAKVLEPQVRVHIVN